MSAFASSSSTDFQPSGCAICGVPCSFGVLCEDHRMLSAYAAWVDDGLMSDWTRELGSEPLNHRTMLVQPAVDGLGGSAGAAASGAASSSVPSVSWRDQLAVIVRRFGRWVGLDGEPPDPWGV